MNKNLKLAEIAQRIGVAGAARAALLPGGIEHEMIDHELAAALEQLLERQLAARRFADLGFTLVATAGTAAACEAEGIPVGAVVAKLAPRAVPVKWGPPSGAE